MNIQEYKKLIPRWNSYGTSTESILDNTLKKIKFLESIYMTGGENSHFSDEFKQVALKERQELCQLSSACHSLLKEGESIHEHL